MVKQKTTDQLYDILNLALSESEGYRIKIGNPVQARRLRDRFYAAIRQQRKKSREYYSPKDPAYNCTPWDDLEITINPKSDILIKEKIRVSDPEIDRLIAEHAERGNS